MTESPHFLQFIEDIDAGILTNLMDNQSYIYPTNPWELVWIRKLEHATSPPRFS